VWKLQNYFASDYAKSVSGRGDYRKIVCLRRKNEMGIRLSLIDLKMGDVVPFEISTVRNSICGRCEESYLAFGESLQDGPFVC